MEHCKAFMYEKSDYLNMFKQTCKENLNFYS